MIAYLKVFIAERRERSERSEANNRVLFEIPRYLYIYIYMSVCKCIVQERAHLTQVLSCRPLCIWNTGCCSAHYFEESPIRYIGMADGASSVEDSPDDDSDFSRTCTTTGHRKRRDDDSDLGRTRTATRQKKRSVISQTAAHREERLVVERLQRIPYFITSSCYTCTLPYTSFSLLYVFTLSPYPFFVITHLSNS